MLCAGRTSWLGGVKSLEADGSQTALGAFSRAGSKLVQMGGRRRVSSQFGRKPGLTEAVFFDPSADEPQALDADEVTAALLKACEQAGFES